ncbi:MAG: methylenetetrahydrofolate reductase [Deltaproteobacteria bacterium]|nr:methylenetetrahydrofolate reductase [Deltaproteobacteria bacterium]
MSKSFQESLKTGKFLITVELDPPKGIEIDNLLKQVQILKDRVDGINLTDNRGGMMRLGALPACLLIKQAGGEPILNMACRDKNRLALASEALGAGALGITNILCLTGDHTTHGDQKDAKPVYDLDSVQALKMLQGLMEGKDLAGNPLAGSPQFCLGAVVTPEADPMEPQLLKFTKKAAMGIPFFQTQAVFNLNRLADFIKFARQYETKIIAGLRLLNWEEISQYQDGSLPGVTVPLPLIEEFRQAGETDGPRKALEWTVARIKEIKAKNLGDGVHIMAIGQEHLIPEILDKAGL